MSRFFENTSLIQISLNFDDFLDFHLYEGTYFIIAKDFGQPISAYMVRLSQKFLALFDNGTPKIVDFN